VPPSAQQHDRGEIANTCRSATSLGMMSDEEKKLQRIEDIKELLS
jgi:hypothetical protein